MITTRRTGALCALIALAACGGLSEDEQVLADICIANGDLTKKQCACVSKSMGEALDDFDLALVIELSQMDEDDPVGAVIDLFGTVSDPALMARIENAGEGAAQACGT